MMNTLYDDGTEAVSPVVETFPYNESFDFQSLESGSDVIGVSPAVVPIAPARHGESATLDEKPRVGKEDIPRLISEAHAAGLAEGQTKAATRYEEELSRERKNVADLVQAFQEQRTDYYSKVEIELVHLALAIAAKILHREAQVDRMVVAGLVKVMLERLQQNTKVVVRVRPEDAEAWRHYFRDQTNLQVVEDFALEPKACLIETELGIANLGLDAQLKEVEQGFFDLLARRPDAK
jgi:flagellar biosynthesis/type III secretory pathway protein FliH